MIESKIIKMIEEVRVVSKPIKKETNLYSDLGIDSLSFIRFLIKIEETFSINFDITEMESCLYVNNLLSIVNKKLKKPNTNYD